ncbi:MAG: hypothetical protein C5B50_21260 [Verrucomicrobia bacterium]|nr:MAG: hypothetical protein C5B50_21260 [Verrucomicrobiota bacterium]
MKQRVACARAVACRRSADAVVRAISLEIKWQASERMKRRRRCGVSAGDKLEDEDENEDERTM